ncbi:MAG: TIGR03663 family protein [Chloroflexota bacterium]|nr:MAG: TIGR03663 family protein [Chloroflexota bacterium]
MRMTTTKRGSDDRSGKTGPLPHRGPGASLLDRPASTLFNLNWEQAAYLALILLAGVMRLWDLGSRAMHHDESLHALYSYYLLQGRGYVHDPMMHGPLLFHGDALAYFLFGVNDYTARIVPALFGTILVGLPYFLRGQLGRAGALVAAILLAISPSFLYYSRFIRHDIYMAVWALILVIAGWRYLAERRPIYLYVGAAALSLSFTTKEDTFITVAIFGAFLLIVAGPEVLRALARGAQLTGLSPAGDLLVLLGTLSLPMFVGGSSVVFRMLNVDLAQQVSLAGFTTTAAFFYGTPLFLILLAVTVWIGMRWNRRTWLICAGLFWSIYVPLFTTFFSNPTGLGTGVWGSLAYWLGQHEVQRGSQPWYYYLVLLPVYEFVPLGFGLVAAVYYALRRSLFPRFLTYWCAAALLAYAVAGEKMPWIILYMALPFALLSSKLIGELLSRIDWHRARDLGGWLVVLGFPLLVLAVVGLVAALLAKPGPFANSGNLLKVTVMLGLLLLLAGVLHTGTQRVGRRLGLQLIATAVLGIGLLLTVRASWIASFVHGDIPVEMLVYTQSSPDVPKVMDEIDQVAQRTGLRNNLKITVDATESFTWPWAWYLRDYKNVDYPTLGNISGPPLGDVLLLHASNVDKAKIYLGKYDQGEKYKLRWWYPEDYRGATFSSLARDLLSGDSWQHWWRYFMYREVSVPLGSSDAVAFFPKDASPLVGGSAASRVPEEYLAKQISIPSTLSFGSKGSAPGQLNEPKGITVDGQGNIYVVDGLNNRVQKFDSSGKLLAQAGKQGSGQGEFQPSAGGAWGIAVDSRGNVYVADTWNHRVQKFDSDLKFVAQWGEHLDTQGAAQGNPGKFYGPRGVAIDNQDNVYVTDTGNKRVQVFDTSGKFIAAFGGAGNAPGQFNEPVGIGADGTGNIWVADTWNRRIQKFDKTFKPVMQIPLASGWESLGILNKPMLAIEPTGNVIVTDPENHRLLRFSSQGILLGVIGKPGIDNASYNLPIGVAVDGQGSVFVVEAGNNRVQKLEVPK